MTLQKNQFHMVDIGHKKPTHRLAVAQGEILVGKTAFDLIKNKKLPKGDPLVLAEIAGIQAAKKTYDIIPLCHPMMLDHVEIVLSLEESKNSIVATAITATFAKTGVEMEAIFAVNAALLTIYDLTKMVEPHLIISNVHLLLKKGGKTGCWLSPLGVPDWVLEKTTENIKEDLAGITSSVITLSDRASQGIYEDTSGKYLCSKLKSVQSDMLSYQIVPDEPEIIKKTIFAIINMFHPDIIFTTGGTGIGKKDFTPDVISEIADRVYPGIGEMLRLYGSQFTQNSWLSRSLAAVVGETVLICFPGSEKAVKEGFQCVQPLLKHMISILRGGHHD